MHNRSEFHKSTLYQAVKEVSKKTGVDLHNWRSIFNYGSSEWDRLSNYERRKIMNELKSEQIISLSDVISIYTALNDIQGKSELNKEIHFSISLI